VTAIGDLAISEASRSAKKGEDSYDTAFNNVIDSRDFWSKFIKTENFNASVCYVKDLGDLKTAPVPCQSDDEFNAIAIYSVSYDYHSIFGYFLNGDSIFSREVIVVQEYERDKFQI
jgi:tight adherence protein E